PWAGLPFLVHSATDAGLPGRVLDHPVLSERGVRWAVHHAARDLVPAAADDPALLALSGLDRDRGGALLREPPPDRAERAALLRLALAWRRRTAARLRDAAGARDARGPGGDRQLLLGLVTRPGRVQAAPGWIVVLLPAESVDVAVRRAGLDLDLGWVPWLGTVVEFRYE
ncbi:hypothetical protein PU560_10580, partial [Georgenia sp. 10Sc9-8]|nr:hypothetical protein [Georgenia halotolerans]